MVSPGGFRTVLAVPLGLPEETIAVYDRYLRTEGLRSKSGRGASAAKITPRDAAHLLTAILGSGEIKHAAASVRRYAETRPLGRGSAKKLYRSTGLDELISLPAAHSFVDALEALIASAATGSLAGHMAAEARQSRARAQDVAPLVEIALLTPGTVADIRIAGLASGETASVRYALPSPWDGQPRSYVPPDAELDEWETTVRKLRGAPEEVDRETYQRISMRTILRIADALAPGKEKRDE